jgi:hypothetical protein
MIQFAYLAQRNNAWALLIPETVHLTSAHYVPCCPSPAMHWMPVQCAHARHYARVGPQAHGCVHSP